MSISRQEEILATLYVVCAVLCFGFGFDTWGWIFVGKASMDTVFAIGYAIMEIKAEKKGSVT